jgi:hypothetical protein
VSRRWWLSVRVKRLCSVLAGGALALAGGIFVIPSAVAAPSQWAVTPSPNNAGGGNGLRSVSCTSQTFCLALGFSYTDASGAEDTLVEEWDGAVWNIIPGPSAPSGSPTYTLSSVGCATPTYCVAVGTIAAPGMGIGIPSQAEAATWDGTSWTLSQLNASHGSAYYDVSCFTGSTGSPCEPVGVEWQVDDFPLGGFGTFSPAPDGLGALVGVSCTPSFCMAVGYWNDFGSGAGPRVTVTGGPSTVTAPPVSGPLGALVACSGPTFCMVPGYEWDGSTWSAVPNPAPNVESMSCPSSNDCVAVGGSTIETWDGTSWSSQTNPNPTGTLDAVSCPSPTYCVAVGGGSASGENLVETGMLVPQTVTITSTAPSFAVVGGPTYTPTATGGGSGNPVIITVDGSSTGVCSIASGIVTLTGVGTCTLDANQAGEGGYQAATQVQQSFSVTNIAITTGALPNGSVRVPYSVTLAAIGGNPRYTWKLATGSAPVPAGLTLHGFTGIVSGTPKASGSSTITVAVFDHKTATHPQGTTTKTFSITITQPTPKITKISPHSGPVTGGTKVIITGTALWAPSLVMFGVYPATGVTVNAAGTQITAYSPSQGPGTVDIVVTTPGGASVPVTGDEFTYP